LHVRLSVGFKEAASRQADFSPFSVAPQPLLGTCFPARWPDAITAIIVVRKGFSSSFANAFHDDRSSPHEHAPSQERGREAIERIMQ
jgi:hypothetical protein